MTEDSKKGLLDYLTGTLNEERGTNKELFRKIKETAKKQWLEYLPKCKSFHFNGLIQSNTNDLLVLYGEFIEKNGTEESNSRGIIILLDSNFNPIKSIYEYESGTRLRPIQHMLQIEDGTFVAVDSEGYSDKIDRSTNEKYEKRFIMLNNFTAKNELKNDFIVDLRQSYIFNANYRNFRCIKIYKNPNTAHYIMIGLRYVAKSNTHYDGVAVIDFKINVGSSNEWSIINDDGTNWLYGGSYCEFNSDDKAFWEIVLTHNYTDVNLILWTKDYNEKISLKNVMSGYGVYVDSVAMSNQCVFTNKNEFYFVVNNERWGPDKKSRHLALYKYNNSNNYLKLIKRFELGIGDWSQFKDSIFLDSLDNELYINYCTNVDLTKSTADYYFQRLADDIWNPILVSEQKPYFMENRYLYISKNFNLLSGKMFSTVLGDKYWYFGTIVEVYNQFNYNGLPYFNENSLIPNTVELYSGEDIVFARNIHNLSINDNVAISSVEIPNTYLNNIDITSKELISKTNLKLVKDGDMFQKNIYETVILNFINSIQIIDKNNGNNKYNNVASSYLNKAVNTEKHYDKSKLYDKAILYYKNGNQKDVLYEFQNKTATSANIVLAIYVDDYVDKLEMVSNDKTIIYQSIDLSSLEIGKTYNINQKLEVV